jgi:predicted transcriptional regulator of viral defense system
MPRTSALVRARSEISAILAKEGRTIYALRDVAELLHRCRRVWKLPESISTNRFLAFLIDKHELIAHDLIAKEYGRSTTRYVFGDVSAYELALTLSPRAYFSHSTALALHGLAETDPKTLYLNIEQSEKKPPTGKLTQAGLDNAFKTKPRQSKMIYTVLGSSVIQVAGKNTGRLGVEKISYLSGKMLSATDLERSLIDAVVRPAYAGGPAAVVEAYYRAKDQVSPTKLHTMLSQLNYIYPYHQAVGFLLERTGYAKAAYSKFRSKTLRHDFYLANAMRNPAYSEYWRLYYPKDLPA